jgi:tRNA A37 threonylcarbamoyladenosine synthetase subunit TsaC/SUA5/YrdC
MQHPLSLEAMPTQQVNINDQLLQTRVLEVIHSENPVFMLQLPAVYALVAPSTSIGVAALHQAKQRLPGKLYGSAIGDLSTFLALAIPEKLPDEFRSNPEAAQCMEGAFLRIKVDPAHVNTPAIHEGSHQGLLLPDGPIRRLFRFIEHEFEDRTDPVVFPGKQYSAPLCTSANISGDPLGSIVDEERAFAFAEQQGISLIVTCQEAQHEKGSYPIFYFQGNQATIERQGPRVHDICAAMPNSITIQ